MNMVKYNKLQKINQILCLIKHKMKKMSLPKRSSSCPLVTVKKLTFANGSYEGDIKDEIPHGFGTYTTNKYIYSGLFLSGRFSRGKRVLNNWTKNHPIRCYWEGEWDNFELKSGKQYNEDGSIITGDWINGKLEGKITKTFPNGDKLYCQYKYGITLGFAKLEYENGDILTGIVIDDKFHGYAKLIIKNPKQKIMINNHYHENNVILNVYYDHGIRKDLNYQCVC